MSYNRFGVLAFLCCFVFVSAIMQISCYRESDNNECIPREQFFGTWLHWYNVDQTTTTQLNSDGTFATEGTGLGEWCATIAMFSLESIDGPYRDRYSESYKFIENRLYLGELQRVAGTGTDGTYLSEFEEMELDESGSTLGREYWMETITIAGNEIILTEEGIEDWGEIWTGTTVTTGTSRFDSDKVYVTWTEVDGEAIPVENQHEVLYGCFTEHNDVIVRFPPVDLEDCYEWVISRSWQRQ
jgi:hypothetical protein